MSAWEGTTHVIFNMKLNALFSLRLQESWRAGLTEIGWHERQQNLKSVFCCFRIRVLHQWPELRNRFFLPQIFCSWIGFEFKKFILTNTRNLFNRDRIWKGSSPFSLSLISGKYLWNSPSSSLRCCRTSFLTNLGSNCSSPQCQKFQKNPNHLNENPNSQILQHCCFWLSSFNFLTCYESFQGVHKLFVCVSALHLKINLLSCPNMSTQ